MALRIAVALFLALATPAEAKLDGNGKLPIMGWSGYNAFMQNSGHCDTAGARGYNEGTFIQTADALVKTGLAKSGYQYLNLGKPSIQFGKPSISFVIRIAL